MRTPYPLVTAPSVRWLTDHAFGGRAADRITCARGVPQHRQEIQADQMRDPHFVRARPLVTQLAAKHAGHRQFRRGAGPDRSIPPREGGVAKQIAGVSTSARAIRHIAPRLFAMACLPSFVAASFRFAAWAFHALAYIVQEFPARRRVARAQPRPQKQQAQNRFDARSARGACAGNPNDKKYSSRYVR